MIWNRAAPVHVLIIPKKHIASLDEVEEDDEELLGYLMTKVKKIAEDLELENGYRLVNNCGVGRNADGKASAFSSAWQKEAYMASGLISEISLCWKTVPLVGAVFHILGRRSKWKIHLELWEVWGRLQHRCSIKCLLSIR